MTQPPFPPGPPLGPPQPPLGGQPPGGFGQPGYGGRPYEPPPDNYLVWAILVTILCCVPFGIVSIVKSAEVNSKWHAGDRYGAQQSAEAAKKWATWGLYAGLAGTLLWVLFSCAVGVSGGYGY